MPIRNVTALPRPSFLVARSSSVPSHRRVKDVPRIDWTRWLPQPKSRQGELLLRFAGLGLYTLLLIAGTSLLTNRIASAVAPAPAPAVSAPTSAPAAPPAPAPASTAPEAAVSSVAPAPPTPEPAPVIPQPAPPAKPKAPPAPVNPGASAKAENAVQFALRQLGLPYVWGGAGPRGYDCSGLTMRAYEAVGIHLPHRAALQARAGTRVNLAKRGDLVISNGGGHVSLALGDGTVIEAPQPGQAVSIHRMPRTITAIVRLA